MSVEARIREMLLSSQKNLNEVASSGNDNTNPRQGNSKDASFDDLGDFDKQKPTVATGKDNSASSKAAIAGDSTNPKQGSSKDATWEDLEDRKSTRLELQSHHDLVCRLLLEKKKKKDEEKWGKPRMLREERGSDGMGGY